MGPGAVSHFQALTSSLKLLASDPQHGQRSRANTKFLATLKQCRKMCVRHGLSLRKCIELGKSSAQCSACSALFWWLTEEQFLLHTGLHPWPDLRRPPDCCLYQVLHIWRPSLPRSHSLDTSDRTKISDAGAQKVPAQLEDLSSAQQPTPTTKPTPQQEKIEHPPLRPADPNHQLHPTQDLLQGRQPPAREPGLVQRASRPDHRPVPQRCAAR